jgi:DNA-binding GntR family transcriptional regulator
MANGKPGKTGKATETAKPRTSTRGLSQEIAFEQLRDLIVMGKIAPGSWVVEADLAQRLGLSRTPIRGALQMLQSAGYAVEHRSGTKTRILIAPLTMDDAQELFTIVGKLEGMIGPRLAALPKAELTALAGELAAINSSIHDLAKVGQSNARQIFDLDSTFHRTFVEAAAGPRILSLHRSVKPQIERYWRLYANTIVRDLHLSVKEHNDIIAAIRHADAERLERAIEANWLLGFGRIAQLIEIFGERGSW